MAVIHQTTLTPTKLELLADWLPQQPWYVPTGRPIALAKAGGFRLDDPAGEVGIEFMVATDQSAPAAVSYHLPLTYRGAPLAGAESGLVGLAHHGVLGRRWVYDGVQDPVLMVQLIELLRGNVQAQAQSVSDATDPTVIACYTGTDLTQADVRIIRRPEPTNAGPEPDDDGTSGYVAANWHLPDGSPIRGRLVLVHSPASRLAQ